MKSFTEFLLEYSQYSTHGDVKTEVEEYLEDQYNGRYEIKDYIKGMAIDNNNRGREIKIGKLIKDSELLNRFASDPDRDFKNTKRSPIDVLKTPDVLHFLKLLRDYAGRSIGEQAMLKVIREFAEFRGRFPGLLFDDKEYNLYRGYSFSENDLKRDKRFLLNIIETVTNSSLVKRYEYQDISWGLDEQTARIYAMTHSRSKNDVGFIVNRVFSQDEMVADLKNYIYQNNILDALDDGERFAQGKNHAEVVAVCDVGTEYEIIEYFLHGKPSTQEDVLEYLENLKN